MNLFEKATDKMILEISRYVYQHGEYPPRGTLSKDGKDMGKALTRYKTGEVNLIPRQINLLSILDDFLSKTEQNIVEIETYYNQHGYLPFGEEERRLVDVMGTYKSGKVPVNENQRRRLEKIGVLTDRTERMIRSIEEFYRSKNREPKRGDKTSEGYDMGNAIIGYRNGKRKLTLNQKRRLENIGISLPNASIKEEPHIAVRIAPQKETLADKIKALKEEKENLIEPSKKDFHK